MDTSWLTGNEWARGGAVIAAAIVAGLAIHAVLFAVLGRAAKKFGGGTDNLIVRHCRKPALLLLPLLSVLVVWPMLGLPENDGTSLRRIVVLLLVGSIGWLTTALINLTGTIIESRFRTDHADNLDERRIQTQTQVLRRIGIVATATVTVGVMLMSLPSVRHVGISLFASAGVAGLAIGLAARATLSNVIAGIQIAFSQPIRLDDVVIVEGEWGRIEEIRTTYVVVRIWDQRRLVVPLTFFIERPFQNWTRTTADLLGTVFLHVDYRVPVAEIRAALRRILEESGMWDGKVCAVQVTEARERTLELRALMSARNSSEAWELRCHVREKLIEHVRENHPDSLPLLRAEVTQAA